LRAETGRSAEVLVADLTQDADLHGVEARLRDDRRIAMLVNNAGMAVAGFLARGSGTIVNIASVLALAPELFNGAYSGTKAFVLALSASLHNELADKGVRVQVVLPGATATDFWDVSGVPLAGVPTEIVMPADVMVDAALAGLDLGETVTIPALPDTAAWDAFEGARAAMVPDLSRAVPADRYRPVPAAA
ncbi:MAG TPA: SDR family NAD(P)-dependent oxidoreductase, partial [Geminicoccaceae bacterium]